MTRPHHLADAAHWSDARAAEPTIERQRYDAAVLARHRVGERLMQWQGDRTGEAYDALRLEYIQARNAADRLWEAAVAAEDRPTHTTRSFQPAPEEA